jgi:rubrerythrin
MTSVFEVLSNKEIWQSEAQAKATIQNMHQEVLDHTKHQEKLSTVRSATHRYFMICQTCFWSASYIGTMDIMNELPFETCPTCNDNKIESLPILYDESYRYEYTPTREVVLEFLRS